MTNNESDPERNTPDDSELAQIKRRIDFELDLVNSRIFGAEKSDALVDEEARRLIAEAMTMYENYVAELNSDSTKKPFRGDVEQILMKLNSGILIINNKVPEALALRDALLDELGS